MSVEPYTRDRDLAAYVALLGEAFLARLRSLSPEQHWLDAGAGEARAQAQHVSLCGASAPRCTAIGLSAPAVVPPGVTFVAGDMACAAAAGLADVDLLTDVYGPLQYTAAPHLVVAEYARLLRPGGTLWLMVPATTFVDAGDILDWLRACRGFALLVDPRDRPGSREAAFVRTTGPASITPLELVSAFDGPPPLRRFRTLP